MVKLSVDWNWNSWALPETLFGHELMVSELAGLHWIARAAVNKQLKRIVRIRKPLSQKCSIARDDL